MRYGLQVRIRALSRRRRPAGHSLETADPGKSLEGSAESRLDYAGCRKTHDTLSIFRKTECQHVSRGGVCWRNGSARCIKWDKHHVTQLRLTQPERGAAING